MMQRPVAVKRGWLAPSIDEAAAPAPRTDECTATELSPKAVAPSEDLATLTLNAAYQLSRVDGGGWRATLNVPENINSMADIVLDLGEREVHTSFKGSPPSILELPRELYGVPGDAWKVRFSRKRRELSLEISGLDAQAVAELGGNIDLTTVTQATPSKSTEATSSKDTQATSSKEHIEATKNFVAASAYQGSVPGMVFKLGPQGLGYYKDLRQRDDEDSKPPEACVKDGWTKPKDVCASSDSWNTRNAPYGKDGRAQEFDEKVGSFVDKMGKCDSATAQVLAEKFGKDVKSGKKASNSGLMFDQKGGAPKPMEIDEEAVDIAGALMAHSMIAAGKLQKVSAIVDAGVKVDTPDEMGCTLLEKAILWENVDIAKMLLEKGASPSGLASAGSSPLHRAAALKGHKSQQLVQLLLKHGANKHRTDSFGRTAADIAEASGSSASHQILLAAPEPKDLCTRTLNKRGYQ